MASIAACLLTAATVPAGAESPVDSFVAAQFPSLPSAVAVAVTGEVARAVEGMMGRPYARRDVQYWRADGTTVWVLETHGKTQMITAGFVVRDGRISASQVLVYRESRGGAVRHDRFLRQFTGAALGPDGALDRRIDGITGATISVNAMHNMARLALFLEQIRLEQTPLEWQDGAQEGTADDPGDAG